MLRGVRPFLSSKYDITKHPRYKYLSDVDKKNAFVVEKHLTRVRRPQPPVAPDEPFNFCELEFDTMDVGGIGEIEAN